MKYLFCFISLAISVTPLCLRAEGTTNHLAIHLLLNKIPEDLLDDGTAEPGDAKPVAEPVLSDSDFAAYNVTNHEFTITAEAARRLSTKLYRRDAAGKSSSEQTVYDFMYIPNTPFLLMVSGQPIYVGVFTRLVDPTYYNVAVVLPLELTLSRDSTNHVLFKIEKPLRLQKPGEPVRALEDVRSDPRILAAVKKLGLKAPVY